MNNQVPPHFHYTDKIPEENIVPDGSHVSVVPDWPAPEGSEVTYWDGTTFTLYKMVDGQWRTVGGGVAGDDQEVQYNDNGAFAGDPNFKWNSASKILRLSNNALIKPTDEDASSGDDLNIEAGDSTDGTGGDGGDLNLKSGNPTLGNAGNINIEAAGGDLGTGGDINIQAGEGDQDNGGYVNIAAGGVNGTGDGGGVNVTARSTNDGNGGFINLEHGEGGNGGANGAIRLGASNTFAEHRYGGMQTTDATPVAGTDNRISPQDDSVLFVTMRCIARRTGGIAGTVGDSALYVKTAAYKRIGNASPVLMGAVHEEYVYEDQGGWDATFVISGNDIVIQVTGSADNNVSWYYELISINGWI